MKLTKTIFFLCLTFLTVLISFGQDNTELQEIADEDQKARMSGKIDWKVLNKQDSLRRENVLKFIEQGRVKTAKDYFNAGIIFQHGNDTIASKLSVEHFKKALEMDSTLNRWWYAAAVDRDLMRRNKPQIYGTQFITDSTTKGKLKRYKIDTTKVSDEERKYYKVGTLKEQEERERLMNLKSVPQFYAKGHSVDETIELIKSEFKKGKSSQYNVNENQINSLGYQLLAQNKVKEALRIFELNVKLYPKAWNTYDSLGEVLLKLGRKDEAKNNYKKSLELNPKNENAKKMLETIK